MESLSDHHAAALIEAYENWTTYDFPKDHHTVMNKFADQWGWQ
jgi:hypothetical protein